MCDGFSEAFMAAASAVGESAGAASAAEGAGAAASAAEGASTMATVGSYAGTAAGYAAEYGGAAAAIGSAGMTAYGQSVQADASQKAADYQAKVEANNATLAGYQRSAALQQSNLLAEASLFQQGQMLGSQRAALAANGVDLNSGSAIDQLATTRFLGAQDVNAIQSNAARAAWGYDVSAANYKTQSNLSAWQAANTSPVGQGVMAGGASLLSSASMYAVRK